MKSYVLIFTVVFVKLLSVESTEDNAEFLFENAKLCGDPFADPIWIPVLDICAIECNKLKEYCVENEDLQQQCKTLPDECQKLLQQRILMPKKELITGVFNTNTSSGFSKRNVPIASRSIRRKQDKTGAILTDIDKPNYF
uniref:ShKT domain-containing protein n=1 Tax=Heterorhabditis bacteriophora TaxID=37862 RepID=A0A1I7XPT2_HETBA